MLNSVPDIFPLNGANFWLANFNTGPDARVGKIVGNLKRGNWGALSCIEGNLDGRE